MSHLGALVTPYVDGEMSPAREAEAHAHLAVCVECRTAVALEQAARRRTRESAACVQASAELTARLLAMPSGPVPQAAAMSARPRRTPFMLGGGAALIGLFVLTLFVLGGPRAGTSPSAVLTAADGDPDTAATNLPVALLSGPDLSALSESWALPVGLSLGRLDVLDDGATQTLDVLVTTSAGDARLLERPGSLDPEAVDGAVTETIAGRTVVLVDGWSIVEAGGCVVAVLGETDAATATVIEALPAPHGDDVVSRVIAGWDVLVG